MTDLGRNAETAKDKDGTTEMKHAVEVAQRAVKGLAGDLHSEAAALGTEARQQVGDRAKTQMAGIAEAIQGLSGGLADTAAGLDETWAKPMFGHAADALKSVAGYIREGDPQSFMHDAYRLARERPATVMLGSMAVGFALARAGKTLVAQLPAANPDDRANQTPSS